MKKVDADVIAETVARLADSIPDYFRGHTFLEQPRPQSETHHLHFVRHIKGVSLEFIHMFKLDFRFASDMGTNYRDGTADFYPSYTTDKIHFKSMLIPVESVEYKDGIVCDFVPVRIQRDENIETDHNFFVHTLFDDFDPTEINEKIYEAIDADTFPFSRNIYRFIEYAYFTAVLNIPDPCSADIEKAAALFEVMFCRIKSVMGGNKNVCSDVAAHKEDMVWDNGLVVISDSFRKKAQDYFKKYSIYQDDELAMKRWRRIDVSH